jgi:hypothetical protein
MALGKGEILSTLFSTALNATAIDLTFAVRKCAIIFELHFPFFLV